MITVKQTKFGWSAFQTGKKEATGKGNSSVEALCDLLEKTSPGWEYEYPAKAVLVSSDLGSTRGVILTINGREARVSPAAARGIARSLMEAADYEESRNLDAKSLREI